VDVRRRAGASAPRADSLSCCSRSVVEQLEQTSGRRGFIPGAVDTRNVAASMVPVEAYIVTHPGGQRSRRALSVKPGAGSRGGKRQKPEIRAVAPKSGTCTFVTNTNVEFVVGFLHARHIMRGGLQLFLANAGNSGWRLRHAVQHSGFDANAPRRHYTSSMVSGSIRP
jgi:hypothetical protein